MDHPAVLPDSPTWTLWRGLSCRCMSAVRENHKPNSVSHSEDAFIRKVSKPFQKSLCGQIIINLSVYKIMSYYFLTKLFKRVDNIKNSVFQNRETLDISYTSNMSEHLRIYFEISRMLPIYQFLLSLEKLQCSTIGSIKCYRLLQRFPFVYVVKFLNLLSPLLLYLH